MPFRPDPAEPDFEQLRAILSSAQLQKENNPLYQLLSQLITKISALKSDTNIKIDADRFSIRNLLLQLNQIDKDKTDGPATSTDRAIARWDGITGKKLLDSTAILNDDGTISDVTDPVNPQDVATKAYVDLLAALEFLTASDESVALPNSRQLLAGTNITFDDTVPNERTINASGGGAVGDHVVLSDGVVAGPTPINDGAGNFIYVAYTP